MMSRSRNQNRASYIGHRAKGTEVWSKRCKTVHYCDYTRKDAKKHVKKTTAKYERAAAKAECSAFSQEV